MIYLLNRSPHNEDFLLDAYATTEAEIAEVAKAYFISIFGVDESQLTTTLDMKAKTIIVKDRTDDYLCETSFNIKTIPSLTELRATQT